MPFRTLFFLLLPMFFACRSERQVQAVLHTDMGDIRVRLFDNTPEHRDNFVAAAGFLRDDSLEFYRVERDYSIQFGVWPVDSIGHDLSVKAEIKALPIGGALAAVPAENGKFSDGTDFFIVLDHVQTDASLDALEKKLDCRFAADERQAYKKHGGLPQLQGHATIFGEVVQGMEVAQRIAAVPRDAGGHPLTVIRVRIELVR